MPRVYWLGKHTYDYIQDLFDVSDSDINILLVMIHKISLIILSVYQTEYNITYTRDLINNDPLYVRNKVIKLLYNTTSITTIMNDLKHICDLKHKDDEIITDMVFTTIDIIHKVIYNKHEVKTKWV